VARAIRVLADADEATDRSAETGVAPTGHPKASGAIDFEIRDAEKMRARLPGLRRPTSRQVAGVRKKAIVVALPGSEARPTA
jgi:hypothetical protein